MSNCLFFRPLVALLLFALTQVGIAGTLTAPELRQGQFVYRIPADFIPDKLSAHGLQEIQQAASRLRYPFYVVFVERLPTQTGASTEDDTERAIVGLAEDWARDPKFNRNRSTLYLVSYGPGDRKYKMLPAPLWRTELGLESEALSPYNQIFRTYARSDPQTALTRMMAVFDAHVYDNFDPTRKAQKAEALRRQQEAARRESERREAQLRLIHAQTNLDGAMIRLDAALRQSLDELPTDFESYRSSLRQAAGAREGNRLEAMETWAGQLNQDATTLEQYSQQRRSEKAAQNARQAGTFAAAFAVVALFLGAVVVRWRRIAGDRAKVAERVATWRGWITQARQRYYQFDENRERAPHLRAFGGKTAELYLTTSREIDSIIIGVEAVATLLDSAEAKARQASFLNRSPLNQAIASLDRPVTFATDKISDKLFEPVEKTIEVTPSAFLADLSSRYDAAVGNWQALNESVTRSLELPDALFPHTGLDALLDRAHAQGIPERWLTTHPLMGDAEADRDLYAKVNENRISDPYAYALQIDELKAREAKLASDLERLIEAVALARSKRVGEVSGLTETVLNPDDDPQITLDAAHRELKRAAEMLLTANSVEAVEEQARKTDELYAKTASQVMAAYEAIRQAPLLLKQGNAAYDECRALEGRSNTRAEEVSREHTDVASVRSAQGAAQRYLDAGARDLAKAEAKLQDRRHLGAQRDAQQALTQFTQATVQMNDVLDMCAELDAVRARYEQRLMEMERLQQEAQRRIRHYNGSPHLIDSFRSPMRSTGPADFGYLLGLLQQQEDHWNAMVRRAEREYEAEQRRRREAEEAERRRREAALYASSRSSSSSSSSSRSSSSGSSGGSFSGGGSGSQGGSW